ncbi:MAG: ABC transporter ATP-binding protein [Bacteroidetes bacterium]|nr:MAG: ABC transporter ATP-binding protein [Bacteroidota bacterium]
MIEIKNISKSFADKKILKNISATFEKGKVNLIIGQSGSGKTVLLKSIVGLHNIDEGDIIYDNRIFSEMNFKLKKNIRKEIGMLFQGGALFDSISIEANVMFPLNLFTDLSFNEKIERVNFCLNRVNLENSNNLFPSELSGGMQKRAAIARAIALNPKYLFCDEPNSGLDPKTAIVIDDLIKEITQEYNITTIVNTHDMNSVIRIGDKIFFIYNGEKSWEGERKDLFNTNNKELNNFLFANEYIKKMRF